MSAVAARFVGRNLVRGSDAVECVVAFEVVDGHAVRVVRVKRVCRGLAGGDEDLVRLACLRVGHGVRAVVDDVVTVRTPEDLVDVAVIVPFGVEAAEQRRLVGDFVATGVDLVEAVEQHHYQAEPAQDSRGVGQAVNVGQFERTQDAYDGENPDRDQPPVPVLPEHEDAQGGDQAHAEDGRAEVEDDESLSIHALQSTLPLLPITDRRLLAGAIGSRYSHNFPAFLRECRGGL